MNRKERHEEIKRTLKYLVDEGMAKKVGEYYRLKTKAEAAQELKEIIENENN